MAANTPSPPPDDEPVPVFGTWPRIYAAVIVSALAVMALVAAFSAFPY
jgi:hypothetical protein